MTVIRVDLGAGGWKAIPMALARNEELTLRAKAFAFRLAMMSDGWEVVAAAVPRFLSSRHETIGRDLARALIRELEDAGYLHRRRTRDDAGRWKWESVFTPVPSSTMPVVAVDGEAMPAFAGHGVAVDRCAVGGMAGDLQKTRVERRVEQLQTTTTTDEQVVVVGLDEPSLLSHRSSILRSLSVCPLALRQAVVDEAIGIARAGRVRANVGALVRKLVDTATAGTFEPAAGISVAAERERCDLEREQRAAEAEERRRRNTPEARAASKAAADAALQRLAGLRTRSASSCSSSVAVRSACAGGDQ
ncbi:MAG TPA: hypothetical protein VFR90_06855 [Methylibium sp.]|uniref:hypothetical protein n=1 Tax=Methylibium sp. TaxID=2067992 RepID=UPI002DB5A778|nr:hypothetical protein [Methylibium sp.]HEU4458825.1 hypothetical protein [Methylibium sp.]